MLRLPLAVAALLLAAINTPFTVTPAVKPGQLESE